MIKNVSQHNKHGNNLSCQQAFIKRFRRNQKQYNYKLDENI